jgi:hypothetical protein
MKSLRLLSQPTKHALLRSRGDVGGTQLLKQVSSFFIRPLHISSFSTPPLLATRPSLVATCGSSYQLCGFNARAFATKNNKPSSSEHIADKDKGQPLGAEEEEERRLAATYKLIFQVFLVVTVALVLFLVLYMCGYRPRFLQELNPNKPR